MNGQHCTSEQLQMFLDKTLAMNEQVWVQEHVRTCTACGRSYASLARFQKELKNLPLEKVQEGFTRNVLASLGIAPKSPLIFRLLEKGAYLFGLCIVLGIMLVAFVATGVIPMQQITEGGNYVNTLLISSGSVLDKSTSVFSNALKQYLPFAFGKGSMGVSLFTVLVVAGLAIADKLFGGRFVHKIR